MPEEPGNSLVPEQVSPEKAQEQEQALLPWGGKVTMSKRKAGAAAAKELETKEKDRAATLNI